MDHAVAFKELFDSPEYKDVDGDSYSIEGFHANFERALVFRQQMLDIVQATKQEYGTTLKGSDKILHISHSRAMRAFASNEGPDPDRIENYLGSFFAKNVMMTPFKVV
jgi:hypothetical protein